MVRVDPRFLLYAILRDFDEHGKELFYCVYIALVDGRLKYINVIRRENKQQIGQFYSVPDLRQYVLYVCTVCGQVYLFMPSFVTLAECRQCGKSQWYTDVIESTEARKQVVEQEPLIDLGWYTNTEASGT